MSFSHRISNVEQRKSLIEDESQDDIDLIFVDFFYGICEILLEKWITVYVIDWDGGGRGITHALRWAPMIWDPGVRTGRYNVSIDCIYEIVIYFESSGSL